jgi:thymidine kinase
MRLSNETEQMVVGSDNYIPVCRRCYEKNSKRQSQLKVL